MSIIETNISKQQNIINRIASGENQISIAKDHNLTQSRISQLKTENKGKVEEAKQKLIAAVPNILETIQQDIVNNQAIAVRYANDKDTITTTDIAYKSILQKQSSKMLESVGILSSHTSINNFGNIQVNNQKTNMINTTIAMELGQNVLDKLQQLSNEEIVDV
jgi:hypothetical protein